MEVGEAVKSVYYPNNRFLWQLCLSGPIGSRTKQWNRFGPRPVTTELGFWFVYVRSNCATHSAVSASVVVTTERLISELPLLFLLWCYLFYLSTRKHWGQKNNFKMKIGLGIYHLLVTVIM